VKLNAPRAINKKSSKDLEQMCVRETNESEPTDDASKSTMMSSKPEMSGPSGISLSGVWWTGQTATGVKGA
jgi:hypothetical protein